MFENKVKRPTHRVSTSKSTSRNKITKKQFIEALYTDTTALNTVKSKSQCLSREKEPSRKSIEIKKINRVGTQKFPVSKRPQKQFLLDYSPQSRSRKPTLYDNIITQKAVELKWGRKSSIAKRKQTKSVERQKKQWQESKIPYNFETVLLSYSHLLTKYQQSEIKEYKKVYYIGHKAKKTQKIDMSQANFDNQQKQYNFLIHDHIAYRFQILALIGKGSYGQVFRVFDHKQKQQLALKMIKNRSKFSKQAFIQIQILTYIKENDPQGNSNIIKIKDFVIFRRHVCLLFQLMSENLYELIIRNNYNGLNVDLIRRFAIQILTAIEFLRKNSIIHCDLKPQNILLKQYHRSGIKIIDFGSSCFEHETIYTYIQSRYYRAPEITLGIQYDCKIDMWSAGCILGELYTGVPLFPGENQNEQMKYFVNTLGPPSDQLINKGTRSHHFFQKGTLKKQISNLATIQYFSKSLTERIPDEKFRQFLSCFLKWDPKQRVTPVQALKNEWIVHGMPQNIRFAEFLAKQDQKQIGNKSVRIVKSKSKQKKPKLSFTNIHSKKLRQTRQ